MMTILSSWGKKLFFTGKPLVLGRHLFCANKKAKKISGLRLLPQIWLTKKSPGYPHPNEHVKKTSTIDGFGVLDPKKNNQNHTVSLFLCCWIFLDGGRWITLQLEPNKIAVDLLKIFEATETYSPKWWFDGDLQWYKVKKTR